MVGVLFEKCVFHTPIERHRDVFIYFSPSLALGVSVSE